MSQADVQAHVREIEACNQRGGRMLSLVDLLDAGTVDLALAAYLAAAMRSGASLLVGARPGGAGKTAVMCALLNFLPDHTVIRPVEGKLLTEGLYDHRPGETCYLAHEIGGGHYYAYIWNGQARTFFRLAANGHIVASNLHADTLDETYDQLCRGNGVERAHVQRVRLKVYLHLTRGQGRSARRWVSQVYEGDSSQDRLLWEGRADGTFVRLAESAAVSRPEEQAYSDLLSRLLRQNVRRIEDVRCALLSQSAEGA